VRAVVRVVEYPVWRLRYGVQFNDERNSLTELEPSTEPRLKTFGILTDLQNQNLFGRAITAGIAGRYERNRQAGSLFMSNSSFFGLPIRSSGFLYANRKRSVDVNVEGLESTTIEDRRGVSAEQRWRPLRTSEVIWSYRFERASSFDPDSPTQQLAPLNVSRIDASLVLDRRDDPTNPARGWLTTANWDQPVRLLGSDYGVAKVFVQHSRYVEFGGLILAGRAQVGSAFGGGENEDIPPGERFELGGSTTIRGYPEDSLGPRSIFGFPVGGSALLALNGEVRFPVWRWFAGVGFVDAGNVFQSRRDLSIRDLAAGYGFGLRIISPYALIRVDFGIPARTLTIDKPAHRLSSGRWYFGIGHIF
jgi:outer membrane protein insertion porin family